MSAFRLPLALSEAEKFVFRRAKVMFPSVDRLCATVYGEPLDRKGHHSGTHIKAVTYHQLQIVQNREGWSAQVFLDL